nr:MAG TPA: hypothetical protein [Caudoviricetes sp.]
MFRLPKLTSNDRMAVVPVLRNTGTYLHGGGDESCKAF